MNTLKDLLRSGGRSRCFGVLSVLLVFLLMAGSAAATTVVAPEFPELVKRADYIVRAVVKSVKSEWRESNGHRSIFTLVELDVREIITGTPPQPLILEMLGGKVDDRELLVEGTPRFKVGDENIFFVRGNGHQFYPLVALMHGSYAVKREAGTGREYVARSNGQPLFDENEVAQPMAEGTAGLASKPVAQALSPAEFARRIRDQHDKNDNRPQLEK